MDNKYEEAKEILKKYNQNHIIKFMDLADEETKEKMIEQVLRIDFEELKELQEKTYEELFVDLEELEPITAINPDRIEKSELDRYKKIGEDLIKKNKFAIATMAGGQGTRLRISISKRNI